MCKEKEPWADFVGFDLFGNEYNCKYPPASDRFSNEFGGYSTPNQETFFYDFCILQYGVVFSFEDQLYEAEFTDDGPILTNRFTQEVQGPFDDAVKLLENSDVKGKKMINILDELENIVLH